MVIPDSFSTRGAPDGVCLAGSRGGNLGPNRRVQDAFDALGYAQRLPYVDAKRIGVMGGSHGGSTTLLTMGQPGFRAGVALYPRCSPPAADCNRLARDVTPKIYPGAHHSFDSDRPVRFVAARINPASASGRGATTGGNAAAWNDAIRRVMDFFDRNLSRS